MCVGLQFFSSRAIFTIWQDFFISLHFCSVDKVSGISTFSVQNSFKTLVYKESTKVLGNLITAKKILKYNKNWLKNSNRPKGAIFFWSRHLWRGARHLWRFWDFGGAYDGQRLWWFEERMQPCMYIDFNRCYPPLHIKAPNGTTLAPTCQGGAVVAPSEGAPRLSAVIWGLG